MKIILLNILFLLISLSKIYSQNKEYIISEKDNTIWIDNFKKSSKKDKLELINNRILGDSITAIKRSWSRTGLSFESRERMRNSEIEFFVDKIKVDSKILLIYNLKSTKKYIKYHKPSIVSITDLLTLTKILDIKDIENFEILSPGVKATAIYGISGRFGVIQIYINKESKFKEIEKIIADITKHNKTYN